MPDARPSPLRYVAAAFSFRPYGMFVAPNWIALGIAGVLGVLHPAFWIAGLVGEGLYLMTLAGNARFRNLVDARVAGMPTDADDAAEAREEARLAALPAPDRDRYARLRAACETILAEAPADEPDAVRDDRTRLLERLLGLHLQLLQSRQALARALAGQDAAVPKRLAEVRQRLAATPDGDLRATLQDQADVLAQRAEGQAATRARAAWVDAELARIEEHVGLMRDQALLRGDPARLGAEVDTLTDLLSAADRWLAEQRELDGAATALATDALSAERPRLRPPQGQRTAR